MVSLLALMLVFSILVFAQEEEADELSTSIRIDVIDYRGGRDWRPFATNPDRIGIPGVEINIFIGGELYETAVTNRRGTISLWDIYVSRENPPVIELQIVQAEGFEFDTDRIPVELENIYAKESYDVVAFGIGARFILEPIDPDLPLGGADLQWLVGSIRVREYYLAEDWDGVYVQMGDSIIGAEVNVYVNGDLHSTITQERFTMNIEIPLPRYVEPVIELRLVQADGFAFDSEKVTTTLRDAVEDNVVNFWFAWHLHPAEEDTPPAPAPNLNTASSWARDSITEAVALGIVPQALQNNYRNNITRAEFTAIAVLLYETIAGTEITGRVNFNDTTDVNVEKAAYLGIITGTGGNNFSPNMQFNRQQAAVIIVRLAEALNQPLPAATPAFADNSEIASWAREQAGQTQAAGIMEGVGGNRFNPAGTFTREQSIVTMLRLFNHLN